VPRDPNRDPVVPPGALQHRSGPVITVKERPRELSFAAAQGMNGARHSHTACLHGDRAASSVPIQRNLLSSWLPPPLEVWLSNLTLGARLQTSAAATVARRSSWAKSFPESHSAAIDYHDPHRDCTPTCARAGVIMSGYRYMADASPTYAEREFGTSSPSSTALHDMPSCRRRSSRPPHSRRIGNCMIVEPFAGEFA